MSFVMPTFRKIFAIFDLLYFHKFCLKKEESKGGLGGGLKDSHLIYICDTAYKYTFDDLYVPFIYFYMCNGKYSVF